MYKYFSYKYIVKKNIITAENKNDYVFGNFLPQIIQSNWNNISILQKQYQNVGFRTQDKIRKWFMFLWEICLLIRKKKVPTNTTNGIDICFTCTLPTYATTPCQRCIDLCNRPLVNDALTSRQLCTLQLNKNHNWTRTVIQCQRSTI